MFGLTLTIRRQLRPSLQIVAHARLDVIADDRERRCNVIRLEIDPAQIAGVDIDLGLDFLHGPTGKAVEIARSAILLESDQSNVGGSTCDSLDTGTHGIAPALIVEVVTDGKKLDPLPLFGSQHGFELLLTLLPRKRIVSVARTKRRAYDDQHFGRDVERRL
ncbi:hypothetical protein GCM10011488_08680 [Steroidobacter agaridevorans]|nr:hypothetical protein GCM10011488_08680 [Steroidobacter agaridevorans]